MIQKFFKTNIFPITLITAFVAKSLFVLLDLNTAYFNVTYLFATLGTALVIYAPAFFFRGPWKKYFSLIAALITSVIFFIDVVYFRYFTAIPSLRSLLIAPQLIDVSDSILSLISFKDILLFVDFLFLVLLFKKQQPKDETSKAWRAAPLIIGLLIFVGIFINDQKDYIPKFINNVYESKLVVQRYGLLGSHFFDTYRVLFKGKISLSRVEEKKTLDWLYANAISKPEVNALTGAYKNKNIIMIQVESLQNFVIGKKVENQEITPNLNKLIDDSYYFKNNHFIIGLGNTSDADIAANTSLLPLNDAAIAVKYNQNDFTSLPKALKEQGYSTSAYHGFFRDFWNRIKTFKSLGYENFYAKDNYGNGKRIGMGLNDKDFLRETLDKIEEQKKPSFNYLITLSSHHPFSINDEDKVINLDQAKYNEQTYRYYNLIAYTDDALGQFMEGLKERGLYEDSIIVLYGDHLANHGDLNLPKTKESIGLDPLKESEYLEFIKVPLVVHLPGQTKKIVMEKASSNLDIMPTILNLVGSKGNLPMFGKDLFGKSQKIFVSMALQYKTFVTDGERYLWENGNGGKCTNQKGDQAQGCEDFAEQKKELLTYSERLVKNNLFGKLKEVIWARQNDQLGVE